VAIVKTEKWFCTEGYGVKSIETKEKWMRTLFGIALKQQSVSSAALQCLLV
jgi:hypothetical protein